MNVYAVVLSCERHYGNGYMRREVEPAQKVIAEDGDSAVKKAKEKVKFTNPVLEGLTCLEGNVE